MTQLLCFFQSVFKQDGWLANTITALYLAHARPRLTSINSPASRLRETQHSISNIGHYHFNGVA